MIASKQLHGRHQCRHEKTKHGVDAANVSKLIRIGKMLAIPRDPKVNKSIFSPEPQVILDFSGGHSILTQWLL